MQQAGSSTLATELFPSWESVKAAIHRYRGRVALGTEQKRRLLNRAVTDEWRSAEEIAAVCGLPFHCCTKLLVSMALSGDLEARADEWIDHRHRNRRRTLYRKQQDLGASMDVLMRAFGMVSAEMRTDADYLHCRKHLLGD